MATYPGIVPSSVGNPRLDTVTLTNPTFPRVNAGGSNESMTVPIRAEKSVAHWTDDTVTLANKTPHIYRKKFDAGIEIAQSDNPLWLNLMKLAQQGPIDAFLKNWLGVWNNFTGDITTDTTPLVPTMAGRVSLVGTNHKNSDTMRGIEVKLSTAMTVARYGYLTSHTTAVTGGATVGAGLALTAITSDATKILPFGYFRITSGGFDIGLLNSIERTWSIEGTSDVQMGQNLCKELKCTIVAKTHQIDAATLAAITTHSAVDQALVLYSNAGEVETYTAGCMRPKFEVQDFSDDYALLTITWEGTFELDAAFASRTDFTTAINSPTFSN